MRIIKTGLPSQINGITLWPFILIQPDLPRKKMNRVINHERIHEAQIRDCEVLGFYWLYLTTFLRDWWQGSYGIAYRLNPFEIEARMNDENLNFLMLREPKTYRFWAGRCK